MRRWKRWGIIVPEQRRKDEKNLFTKLIRIGMVLFLIGGFSFSVFSATHTVTSTADTGSSGTLRYEIINAVAGDIIVFNLTYPAVITLTNGVLTLNKNLTILGPGVNSLTISGNNSTRVFDITAGTITLSDLTITSGRLTAIDETGAGLRISGASNVTLDRCMVRDCSLTHMTSQTYGAGITVASTAALTVLRSCFYNNQNAPANPGSQGGAIDNRGTLTMVDSLCVSNTAFLGAAIYDQALSPKTVTLLNCTFTGNSTDNQGVVFHWGSGTTVMTNCTITKNYSISGASYEAGISIYNMSGSGTTSFSMKNSVVAGNVAITGMGDSDIYFDTNGLYGNSISFTSLGYNLIGSTGSQPYTWTTGDIVGTESAKQLANFANLAYNGGHTASHVPNLGSQVINPASSNGSTFVDGRGYLRVSTSEKGATEYGASAPVASAATSITSIGFNANWNSMTGASGYLLDVATDSGFTAFVSGHRSLNVNSVLTYAVSGLTSGVTYYYRVRGYNGVNQTYYTNTISAVPVANSPTITISPTATSIITFTHTPTVSASPTSSITATSTSTKTPTAGVSETASPAATSTPSITATSSISATMTVTSTFTQVATSTITVTIPNRTIAYPNPARDKVTFVFDEERIEKIQVFIYNVNAERIALLTETSGSHKVEWVIKSAAPGVYVYYSILTIDGKEKKLDSNKIAVIK